MKTPKLLKISQEILSTDKSKQRKRVECLKEIQHKLKKKGKLLKKRLEDNESEKERKRLEKELKVLYAQRSKVVKALKELK